ncbi:MAG: cyclic peptide export ABC transporter [Planctomycetaceae bacterium]|nr:cyclic peptide export ABC transporter [Planctomycetaceae bacterium]
MNLFRFLKSESPETWYVIVAMSLLSGIANGFLLAVINSAADVVGAEKSLRFATPYLFILFGISMAIFVLAKRHSMILSTQVVENMVMRMRVRICDKLRKSELMTVERLDRPEVFTKITQDTNVISQSAFVIIEASEDLIMLLCCLIYLAWISMAAFLVTIIGAGLANYAYFYHLRSVHQELKAVAEKETELFGFLSYILYGFKELRLSMRKSNSLFGSLTGAAEATRDLKTRVGFMFVTVMMFSQVFVYLLLAMVVFVLPQYIPTYSGIIIKTTSTILFIVGPFNMVVNASPSLSRADVALDNLYTLERTLDESLRTIPVVADQALPLFADFREIALKDVTFTYTDVRGEPLFSVGPIDLRVRRGEMVFIVGGNGSGKSTLLKLITGLYFPSSGRLTVDGRRLDASNIQGYREMFTTIFTDFYLFERLIGLEDVPEERVNALIGEMELADKVQFVDGRFSTLNLSTGQRKRLALIAALLEDKDIYVLDEWAADQDQHFRQRFYEVILQDLKARGKTILAVTHDDRYWGAADRLIKLELGKIVSDEILH